ncbi:MAG: hypothetical protein EBR09_16970 [Proteobacteria bacterium]|jgi:hypothetical protein|nr:hypothetical protein [Pseudomonadota bacterium]
MSSGAGASGPRATASGCDALAILQDPDLRRSVILRRHDEFVNFGLRVLELEDERRLSGQESLWPAYVEFIDAQLQAALGARASEHKRKTAKQDVAAALAAVRAEA